MYVSKAEMIRKLCLSKTDYTGNIYSCTCMSCVCVCGRGGGGGP